MAVVSSKLKSGTLKLGPTGDLTDFACQAINIRLTPDHTTEEGVETLCGDSEPAATTTKWTLNIESIQDFENPDGFQWFTIDNNLEELDFEWTPDASGAKATGKVQVLAVEMGGEVAKRIQTSAAWPITGEPTWTKPVAP